MRYLIKWAGYYWKALAWGIIILVLSSISGIKVQKLYSGDFQHMDKIIHFIMYFVFTFFLLDGIRNAKGRDFFHAREIFWALTISIFFGVFMEILQITFFVNRSGEILDFVANTLGSLTAALISGKIILLLVRIGIYQPKS